MALREQLWPQLIYAGKWTMSGVAMLDCPRLARVMPADVIEKLYFDYFMSRSPFKPPAEDLIRNYKEVSKDAWPTEKLALKQDKQPHSPNVIGNADSRYASGQSSAMK